MKSHSHDSSLENLSASLRTAEIVQFSPAQVQMYENSLKYYRDMNNVIDTAIEERGRTEEKRIIARATGLSDRKYKISDA